MSEVRARAVYLGSMEDARDAALLDSLGVTRVLNCAAECPCFYEGAPLSRPLRYLHLPLADARDQPLLPHVRSAVRFLAGACPGDAALVHCVSGVSRAPSVLVAALMCAEHATLARALGDVLEARPQVCPNEGFLRQLVELDRALSPSGAAPSVTLDALLARVLARSGFDEQRARTALRLCGNDVDAAVELLRDQDDDASDGAAGAAP
eukprot:m51a1_g5901 putative dual specificity catalytic domain containing protein (208) ;mRNA; f:563126-563749